jgi:hypothetical protein
LTVVEFDHDDPGYIRWHFEHSHDGFIVNIDRAGPEDSYLHRGYCETLQRPIDEGMVLTVAYPKACSTRRSELREFWKGGRKCSICDP